MSESKTEVELRKTWESDVSTFTWVVGMMTASIFSSVYMLTPLYFLTAIFAVMFQFPSKGWAFAYASPILLSIVFKPVAFPWLVGKMTPVLQYFQFEQIIDISKVDVPNELRNGTNYILACQPHGVITFCGLCSAINAPPEFRCTFPTCVASIVLKIPILKHVLGIFGLTDASKGNLQKILKKPGVEGSIVLYVGGMAELFMSSRKVERLFLSKRKGFIKLALTEGVDIVPIYLFGNTSVLTVVKTGLLAKLSRKWQVSLTYFWGKYKLPIPRDDKLLYVSGQPLGMPQISDPSQEDIDKWHAKYCVEVTRLFDKYKEKVPMYKHKTLVID